MYRTVRIANISCGRGLKSMVDAQKCVFFLKKGAVLPKTCTRGSKQLMQFVIPGTKSSYFFFYIYRKASKASCSCGRCLFPMIGSQPRENIYFSTSEICIRQRYLSSISSQLEVKIISKRV